MANIRTARRSGLVLRGGKNRRSTVWIQVGETNNTITSASTAVLFTGLDATSLTLRPLTVVRTHVQLHMASDQEVADEIQQCALSFAVVSEQALAIGVTAVPTPFTDAGSDAFFYWQQLTTRFLLGSAVGFSGDFGVWKDTESKAMRKVEEGEDIAAVIESSSLSNGFNFIKSGRMLLKLH